MGDPSEETGEFDSICIASGEAVKLRSGVEVDMMAVDGSWR